MKNLSTSVRAKGVAFKTMVATGLLAVASTPAFAQVADDIAAAKAEGISNVTLAVGAVIAIAAIALGVGIIRSLLSR